MLLLGPPVASGTQTDMQTGGETEIGAMFYYQARGGEVRDKKRRGGRVAFSHKTDFCCIQQPNDSLNDGFYVLHHMLEYRRDH